MSIKRVRFAGLWTTRLEAPPQLHICHPYAWFYLLILMAPCFRPIFQGEDYGRWSLTIVYFSSLGFGRLYIWLPSKSLPIQGWFLFFSGLDCSSELWHSNIVCRTSVSIYSEKLTFVSSLACKLNFTIPMIRINSTGDGGYSVMT